MKERPILFKCEMVRAILEGRKTQTRRLVKPQPKQYEGGTSAIISEDGVAFMSIEGDSQLRPFKYGRRGESLWVKETYCHKMENGLFIYNKDGNLDSSCVHYKADGYHVESLDDDGYIRHRKDGRAASPWVSSLYMPRWASRITLEIVSVRVERLQEISGEDAIAEGISIPRCGCEVCAKGSAVCTADASEAIMDYRTLWESINGKGSWELNPWVWVIEFRRIK